MTREEQIKSKAVDYSEIEDNFMDFYDNGDIINDKELIEQAFMQGAKWADQTMVDKACKWLMKYFVIDHYGMSPSGYGVFEHMFRDAMEE